MRRDSATRSIVGAVVIDVDAARAELARDELVFRANAIAPERLAVLRREALALEPLATRMHVPFVRRGGTVGARRLRVEAPALAAIYGELRATAEALADRALFEKAEDDDHAVALYCYRGGDFMASHYDRCGDSPHGSYSVTVGLVDDSRAKLECKLAGDRAIELATPPGSLTIYNGSRIAHAVSRLGPGERRVVLSGSYRTQPQPDRLPHFAQRVVEGFLYFGWPGRERRR
jgi:hypothetical protein